MRAILLANGIGDRWDAEGESFLKQQIPIDGETIVSRTTRMLIELGFGHSEIVVVGPEVLWAESGVVGWKPPKQTLDEPDPLLAGLEATRALWGCGRTLILLADVVFSYNALDLLIASTEPIRFLGRSGANPIIDKAANELFGFVMSSEFYECVVGHCLAMTRRGASINYPPKLWALYRLICGFEHDEYKYEDQILLDPEDYTDDVDSPQEYARYWEYLKRAALEDLRAFDR